MDQLITQLEQAAVEIRLVRDLLVLVLDTLDSDPDNDPQRMAA